MKRIISVFLCLCFIFSLCACGAQPEAKEEKVTLNAAEWMNKQIENDSLFSFKYDGVLFKDCAADWDKEVTENKVTYTHKTDGVKVWADFTIDNEHNSVDYLCHFENTADDTSKVISEIFPLDSSVAGDYTLTYSNGSIAMATDFSLNHYDFTQEKTLHLECRGGRSSSGVLPYFDFVSDKGGFIAAIGWTGQWQCNMEKTESGMNLQAGMDKTNIELYAKESMRTPSIVILFYEGTQAKGHNDWRHLVSDKYTPLDENGNPVTELSMFNNAWGGAGENGIMSQLDTMDKNGMSYDGLWIDAGWYGKTASVDTYDAAWSVQVGDWFVNEKIYPNGLSVIGERLEKNGKEFLLWFEPERVQLGTELEKTYPQYMMPCSSAALWTLFNMADDEACDFMTDLIDTRIKENHITWYRQDFNCEPLGKWDYSDAKQGENRVGMTQIKYITNLYRYLDTLLERNPGLMIDNCASGGQRLDIEMMKRSVPLWRSDYTVNGQESTADGVRNINMNLSYWIPLHCGGNGTDGMDDDYEFRSMMASGLTVGTPSTKFDWHTKVFKEYYHCRKLMTADYYILAQGAGENYDKENAAYMYYDKESGDGYIMLFHPEKAPNATEIFKLCGLEESAEYKITCTDTDQASEATGLSLMNAGIEASFSEPRSAKLLYIDRVD